MRSTVVKLTPAAVVLLFLTSLTALAQPAARVPRVGTLSSGLSPDPSSPSGPFQDQLVALGHTEGRTVILEPRYAEGHADQLPALAAELVRLNVDVIVAWGVEPLEAVIKATKRIPIVMMARADPVAMGLVASLAKPGGNITGVTIGGPEIAGKRLELLREALPGLSRVAVLRDPKHEPAYLHEAESAARALKLRPLVFTIRSPADFDGAFHAAVKARAQAVHVNETSMLSAHRPKLAELALKNRLPAIGSWKASAEAGFMMSFGPEQSDLQRRVATYVDKILKGARPADLPIERPSKFELVVNVKTAKALGLRLPQALLSRADQIIEE